MLNGISSSSYGSPNDIASNDESIQICKKGTNGILVAFHHVCMGLVTKNQIIINVTIALDAMSNWKKRNCIKKGTSKRNWHHYQGRVNNKQSHPGDHQQEDNTKNKAVPAKIQTLISKKQCQKPLNKQLYQKYRYQYLDPFIVLQM